VQHNLMMREQRESAILTMYSLPRNRCLKSNSLIFHKGGAQYKDCTKQNFSSFQYS